MEVGTVLVAVAAGAVSTGFVVVVDADVVGNGICGRSSVGAVKECRNVCSQFEDAAVATAGGAVTVANIEGGIVTAAAAAGGGRRPSPIIIIIEAVMASMATKIGPRVPPTRWSRDPTVVVVTVVVFVVSVVLRSFGLRRRRRLLLLLLLDNTGVLWILDVSL